MSLPSQGGIGFGGATRGRRRRGRGGPRKILAGVIVLAIVGGVVWAVLPGGEPDAESEATGAGSSATLAQATPVVPRTALDGAQGSGQPVAPGGEADRTEDRQTLLASQTPSEPLTRPEPQPQMRTVAQPQQQTPERPAEQRPSVLATPAATEADRFAGQEPSAAIATLVQRAEEALKANDPVAAREHYNRALLSERATESDRASIRQQMAALNEDLMFSPRVYPDDPFATVYEVQSGDSLSRIAQREGVAAEWRLIQRVNRLSNPSGIYVGQKLKLLRGPFHAVVSKSAFRMDVYVGPPGDVDQWVYVRSFTVGLGEYDGTPLGVFTVRRHSKLINPFWRNPRTGEEFAADDPENPIGEHWIGLRGLGQAETYSGYGIHGTIEPESIGREMSMGCVRMLPDDVALVYELLSESISEVHIVE